MYVAGAAEAAKESSTLGGEITAAGLSQLPETWLAYDIESCRAKIMGAVEVEVLHGRLAVGCVAEPVKEPIRGCVQPLHEWM